MCLLMVYPADNKQSAQSAVNTISSELDVLVGIADLGPISLIRLVRKWTLCIHFVFALLSDSVTKKLQIKIYEGPISISIKWRYFSAYWSGKSRPNKRSVLLYSICCWSKNKHSGKSRRHPVNV